MPLRKTTILPTDDAALAKSMLREWIEDQPHVLWFTIGDDDDAEATAERGDTMAGKPEVERWCIWVRDPATVSDVFDQLKLGQWKRNQLDTARAFTLSRDDEVRDLIPKSKPVPNHTRALLAYAKAEAL